MLSDTPSRSVNSSQTAIHPRLAERVRRHLQTAYRRPIATHNQAAFNAAQRWLGASKTPLVLDAGCGVGLSTRHLAESFPQARVIGVDKSARRLAKQHGAVPDNALVLQADLSDFWRLAVAAGWQLWRHYLLYPNPWPKPEHLQRRWHGSALLPFILALGGRLELRSNWRLYIDEFAYALELAGVATRLGVCPSTEPLSPFERKYQTSGQTCWYCVSELQSIYTTAVHSMEPSQHLIESNG